MANETVKREPVVVQPGVGYVNLSPDAFHRWAAQYYECRHDFRPRDEFSPVPYFLLSRSIELEIKARHLVSKRQDQVRRDFGHDLLAAYEALEPSETILDAQEVATLKRANDIYKEKGFEYWRPVDALTGYKAFPDLDALDAIARKLLATAPEEVSSLTKGRP